MMVPQPDVFEARPGRFELSPRTAVIHAEGAAVPAAELLADHLATALGTVPEIGAGGGSIRLYVNGVEHAPGNPEAYRLTVSDTGIDLVGRTPAGLLCAVQALRQLLPPEALGPEAFRTRSVWPLPHTRVEDAPALRWRGLLLDVARHFMPVSTVLRVLDAMALHRLNVLQLHLTDDQGWRLEVPDRPRLTQVGGRRPAVPFDPDDPDDRGTGPAHQGWYTARDIRQIVAFAARRGITVVPEIDVPGHVQAALAAYPELGNRPAERLPVWPRWGINSRTLNAEQATVEFFAGVLEYTAELFPSRVVHLGGDECSAEEWRTSPAALERVAALGLAGPEQVHGWLLARLAERVAGLGRRPAGWEEIAEGPVPAETVVMCWHGEKAAEQAADRGFDVVLTPWQHTYFDLHQAAEGEPRGQKGVLTLADAYAFTPLEGRFAKDLRHRLLGAQCQLWTEYVPTPEHLEYMAFPRVCAFAERAWGSPADYPAFLARLPEHLRRLDALGLRYRRPEELTA
ncbi:beta-N-acetylhexosaminidase [Kitasatospora sp. NPDC049285]|uniref:beta-N-acetylhexosaminidase n=1 Tax=Kitasatospora sp. NPDC049285 TaxID=3157096 RepID=UPI0034290FA2